MLKTYSEEKKRKIKEKKMISSFTFYLCLYIFLLSASALSLQPLFLSLSS